MMVLASVMLAVMTSADAIVTMLNTSNSCSKVVYEEARRIVESEAAKGQPLQQFIMAMNTDDAALAERYLAASRERIKILAETKNNPLAWYVLSLEDNNFTFLKRAADGGNVQALNALGTIEISNTLNMTNTAPIVINGIYRKCFKMFSQAAATGDANSFINLGTCYMRGYGCEQNLELAFQSFRTAAEKGHPEGMDYVAAALQNGHGVKQDLEASLLWTMKARALRGDEAAAKWLRERK